MNITNGTLPEAQAKAWRRACRLIHTNRMPLISKPLSGHTNPIACVTPLPDGFVVSGCYDKILRVWCLSEDKLHHLIMQPILEPEKAPLKSRGEYWQRLHRLVTSGLVTASEHLHQLVIPKLAVLSGSLHQFWQEIQQLAINEERSILLFAAIVGSISFIYQKTSA